LVVGTLGKALGSYGAYVCADAETVELLVNCARSFIFSTAPGPPAIGAAAAALALLEAEPERVGRLRDNAATLREALTGAGLDAGTSRTQIVPIEVGEAEPTMALCERLLERGVFAQGIRPPTVPPGSSRLRLTVMATHGAAELEAAGRLVGELAGKLGIGAVTEPVRAAA
jgi:7-keto-8-aminopelargonate synthetase-like enzyme